jgi:hypothetical protein
MTFTIKRPTRSVEIVTDLQALQDSIVAASDAQEAKGKTGVQALRQRAAELTQQVDESTLVLTLRGLNASQWNQIVIKRTDSKGNRLVKDWPGMISDALPVMLSTAHVKTDPDTTVELTASDLSELLSGLADSQVAELMQTVQVLNTPATSVPKALRELTSPTD